MKKTLVIQLCLAAALVAIVYFPVFVWMYGRWTVADTYYSHGFLVPFISAFLVWRKRAELSKITIAPSATGWWLLAAGSAVFAISALWQVYFAAGFSLLPVLAGLIALLLGKQYLSGVRFPLLFLGFMIPLPMVAISNLSFRLKILAAQIAVGAVNAMGMPVIREGSVIRTAHSYLTVEDPCSGIRSLIALIALGALMAHLSKLPRAKKIVLFVSSVPIAILSNVARIIVLTLVSEMYGTQFATGKFHDFMGFVVFALAFFGLALVNRVLE